MKKLILIVMVLGSILAKGQQMDSIFFNLYTDSLKKGVYNYINLDARFTNGRFLPLTADEVEFSSSTGKWDGNNLIIEKNANVDSVIISAVVKAYPHLKKTIIIYLKKNETEPELKSEKELLDEWQRKSKRPSRRNLA